MIREVSPFSITFTKQSTPLGSGRNIELRATNNPAWPQPYKLPENNGTHMRHVFCDGTDMPSTLG